MIEADGLRSMFLAFFAERGHAILPSASLIAEGDPSVLFTTAGVHPLVPYLRGRPHPAGRLLADCQKCLRTTDITEVSDATHLTFFEMLGNWSLGAYVRWESITWSYELLTRDDLLAIAPQRLWISVFAGNQATPADAEAAGSWRALGIPAERIVYLGEEPYWWALGPEGPCGPDTEVFVDTTGVPCDQGEAGCLPGTCDCGRFVEVWNNVFLTFQRRGGQLLALPRVKVDTGMGLERMLTVLDGTASVYQTAPLAAIHQRIASLSPTGVEERPSHPELVRALRILTDHLRSAVFILGDQAGVLPSNQGRGYVLRRLIRRGVRACQTLGIQPSAGHRPPGWSSIATAWSIRSCPRTPTGSPTRFSARASGSRPRWAAPPPSCGASSRGCGPRATTASPPRWPSTCMTPMACPSSSPASSLPRQASAWTSTAWSGWLPGIGSAHDPNATDRLARPSHRSPVLAPVPSDV
jgi:alanyl-tRNA synthetase